MNKVSKKNHKFEDIPKVVDFIENLENISNNNSNDPRPLLSLGYIPYGEKFDPGFNSKREVKFLN